MRTTHFIIYYSSESESAGREAGVIAEKWHSILSRKLGFAPGGVTPIYLYPDRRSFSEATGIPPGESIVGLAHTRTLVVRLDASGAFVKLEGVIPHELVHVLITRRLRGAAMRLPLWLHEGLAKYLAEDWTAADAELLADAAAGGGIMPLAEISNVFPEDEEKRSIAYVQSYSAVEYLARRYTSQSIRDLLSEVGAGRRFETAFLYSVGVSPEDFEEQWRQHLWEEYKLSRWIKLGSGLVGAAMGVLAILAFRARMIYKRRRARELQEMEDTWRL